MKECTKCGRTYADNSLNFCVDDGSPLRTQPDPEATLVRTSVPKDKTLTRSRPMAANRGSNRFVYPLILGLAFLIGAAGVLIFYNKGRHSQSNVTTLRDPITESQKPITSDGPKQTTTAPDSAPVAESHTSVPNIGGTWQLLNTVENTSYADFRDMQLGYRVALIQDGSTVRGEGEKSSENGHSLPPAARTPIHLTGSISGDRISATFVEQGGRRKSSGRFDWKIAVGGNGLQGRFVSTAANTTGRSTGHKLE